MRFDLCVDVLELRVAIGMASTFLALAIDLTAIAKTFEQLGNPARRNEMSHVAQRRGELHVAFQIPTAAAASDRRASPVRATAAGRPAASNPCASAATVRRQRVDFSAR